MEYRNFGGTASRVPVIGQGTWYDESEDRQGAVAALRQGIDLGMTHIDTAEMYLSGRAEEWVAEAVGSRRNEVFLVSKVLPQNASRQGTLKACEASLAHLKTDRLDCYLLHWRSGRHPIEATLEAFEQLKREGKILSWGVSNFDVPDLQDLDGSIPACNQVLYHLTERAVEHAVVPWCENQGVSLVAYSPFGHGDFPGAGTKGGAILKEVATESGGTSRQVALRFLLRRPFALVIPKSSNAAHVAENAGAADLELSPEQIARIDKAFPRGPKPRGLPML